jgi:hypothetical protein
MSTHALPVSHVTQRREVIGHNILDSRDLKDAADRLTGVAVSEIVVGLANCGDKSGIGLGLAAVGCGLGALLLWPFGRAALGGHLAKGVPVLLVATLALVGCTVVQALFRLESDPPRDPYIIVSLVFGAFVQAGWAAFMALAVQGAHAGRVACRNLGNARRRPGSELGDDGGDSGVSSKENDRTKSDRRSQPFH